MPRVKGQTGKTSRSASIPYRFVGVGQVFNVGTGVYVAVRRTGVVWPREACRGCAFRGDRPCPRVACSPFDREDGIGVWFVEV